MNLTRVRMQCTCEDTYTLRERETILLSLLDSNMLKSNDPSRCASAIASLENGFLLNEIFFIGEKKKDFLKYYLINPLFMPW